MNIAVNLVILAALFAFLQKCDDDALPQGTPDCLRDKISEIASEDVWNPPAKIYSYTYDGRKVYFIPQRCCDIPSVLLDENCNTICAPDGGFSGRGDGQCTDFFDSRKNERLVWEDPRNQ